MRWNGPLPVGPLPSLSESPPPGDVIDDDDDGEEVAQFQRTQNLLASRWRCCCAVEVWPVAPVGSGGRSGHAGVGSSCWGSPTGPDGTGTRDEGRQTSIRQRLRQRRNGRARRLSDGEDGPRAAAACGRCWCSTRRRCSSAVLLGLGGQRNVLVRFLSLNIFYKFYLESMQTLKCAIIS